MSEIMGPDASITCSFTKRKECELFTSILQSRGLEDFHQDLIGAGLLKASHSPPEKPSQAGRVQDLLVAHGSAVTWGNPLLVVRALVCQIN